MPNNLEKVLLYYSIVCEDTIDRFFFIFALSELECDKCTFELYLFFLRTFNNRIISLSVLVLLYSYQGESVRVSSGGKTPENGRKVEADIR
jgi:hypothetical protein